MSDVFPIFIGITGKRVLATAEAAIRERLRAVFNYLDGFLPLNPKVLLTGGAIGADLIAAEEVLGLVHGERNNTGRPNWLVAVALPFEQDLFQEDFKTDEWQEYLRVVADQRTRVIALPPLKAADGRLAAVADLHRRSDASDYQRNLRRRHYEQVGLWIADTANILVGVMPADESADRIGGTARIVACRRSARPDPVAAEVIAGSSVLAPRTELYRAPNGHVWLIDPSADPASADPASAALPVAVLPPAADNTPFALVYAAPAALGYPDAAEDESHDEQRLTQAAHLEESLRVLKIARGYVRDGGAAAPSAAKSQASLRGWPAQNRAQLLGQISNGLRNPTNNASDAYRHAMYRVAGFFALAVLAFEIFAKFMSDSAVALSVYLFMLGAAMFIYWQAGLRDLQPIAEDRRAIREALRVQGAWWQVGLDDRVDFFYLKGADQDLARVREATRNVIVYSSLAADTNPPQRNWKAVFDPESWPPFHQNMAGRDYPKDWIGNQYFYFRQRKTQRHLRSEFIEATSWSLFASAACLAALLLLWLILQYGKSNIAEELSGLLTNMDARLRWFPMLATLGMIAATVCCWWLGGRLLAGPRRKLRMLPLAVAINLPAALFLFVAAQLAAMAVNHTSEPWSFVLFLLPIALYMIFFLGKIVPDPNETHPAATIAGLAAAILISFALMDLAALLGRHFDMMETNEKTAEIARYMTIVLVVFLPTLAGAMRYLAEKLAFDAEALSYRDAYVWFSHATDLLRQSRPGQNDPAADLRAQKLIRRLGMLAIQENEAWLKMRRERPLSPVI